MQRAIIQQATFTGVQSRAERVETDCASCVDNEAVNDDSFREEDSTLKLVLSVIVNLIGGSLLLSGMFFLPHLIARILS